MLRNPKLVLVVAIVLAGSMWFYMQRVLIGHQQAEAALHDTPRGNLSDLYPRWLGARELLLHHRDPYSAEVTREIQTGYYGRPVDPMRPGDPKDQQGFAYPTYVVFLMAPTIGFPFAGVQIGFRWFLIAFALATVLLWLRVMRWRPSLATTASLSVLAVGSFPALQGIKLQQLSLLVAGLIAVCAVALVEDHLALAGIVFAFATIKPQLALPLTVWLLLWALSDWHRRQNFIWGFISTLTILFIAAEYVLPGWVWRFSEATTAYRHYTDAGSLLDELVTPGWGRALTVMIALALALVGWRLRRSLARSPSFGLMLALVLAVAVVIVPKSAPYNQVLLLPGILLIMRDWQVLWRKNRMTRSMLAVSSFVVLWPWLAATVLTVASLFLPARTVQQAWAVPVWTSLTIPLCVVLLLTCCFRELAKSEHFSALASPVRRVDRVVI
jgi:glycosyl transferase family 87